MISWTSNSFLHLSDIMNPVVCGAIHFTQYSDRLWLYSRVIVDQHPTDPKHSLSSKSSRLTLASTQPATQRTSMAFHPGHAAHHWSVFTAEVKGDWTYTATSTCIHSVDMENCILPCRTSHVVPVCFRVARRKYPERYKAKQLFWTCLLYDKFLNNL
jgi:hypothetical protein